MTVTDQTTGITLDADQAKTLGNTIKAVTLAASKDQFRPVLTGVLFEANEGRLRLVATDSYRLHMIDLDIPVDEGFSFLADAKDLAELAKMLVARTTAGCTISVSANDCLIFDTGDRMICAGQIGGEFPSYRTLIPAPADFKSDLLGEDLVRFNPKYLADIGKAVTLLDKEGAVTLYSAGPFKPTVWGVNLEDLGVSFTALLMTVRR